MSFRTIEKCIFFSSRKPAVLWMRGSVGSVCFWIQIRILPSRSKKISETLTSTVFLLLFLIFYLWKVMWIYPKKYRNKQKKFKKTYLLLAPCQPLTKKAGSGSRSGISKSVVPYWSPDPDPYQYIMDPQQCLPVIFWSRANKFVSRTAQQWNPTCIMVHARAV